MQTSHLRVKTLSWETLLVLNMRFKPSVLPEDKRTIVNYVKRELEMSHPSEWGAYSEHIDEDEADFTHVNWGSHVDEERVMKVFETIKSSLQDFSVSLYYLGESDFDFAWDEEEELARASETV